MLPDSVRGTNWKYFHIHRVFSFLWPGSNFIFLNGNIWFLIFFRLSIKNKCHFMYNTPTKMLIVFEIFQKIKSFPVKHVLLIYAIFKVFKHLWSWFFWWLKIKNGPFELCFRNLSRTYRGVKKRWQTMKMKIPKISTISNGTPCILLGYKMRY